MKIVIALGGNALGNTPLEQLDLVKKTAQPIVDLIEEGHQLIIAHGNGPQVGMINNAFEAAQSTNSAPAMPFPECGAMSQGYIGYHLQNAIQNELASRNIKQDVATIVTQVEVEKDDPAFQNPSKPVGPFYEEQESKRLTQEKGYNMIEDSGRGYRRVVASPLPKYVVEINMVKTLVDQGNIVITVGGGGIPVIKENGSYQGVPAVIDKDFASAKVADQLDADIFFVLTAVDRVMVHFNTPQQKGLKAISVSEARKYIDEGHFAAGSMLPKVQAAIKFVENNKNRTSIIASLDKAKEAIDGASGTKITA